MGTSSFKFPVFSLLRADDSKSAMLPTKDGLLLPILSNLEIAEEVKRQTKVEVNLIELPGPADLRSFVENPPGMPDDVPEFNILFDSVDPNERKIGLVKREDLLASLPKREHQANDEPELP